MFAWLVVAPAGFLFLVLILAWLEESIVLPVDRAYKIETWLEKAPADEIEASVSRLLAPVVPRRSVS